MNAAEYNTCVEKYLKMVYRILFHYFGNREDAEDVSQDVFDSIDIVADKLSSQMSKYKGKLQKRNKSNESVRFEMIPEMPEPVEENKVVKAKKFQLVPMTVDEAAMQMELLQHNFYVFIDIETDSVSVVYKRNDGDYGLLETTY